MATRTQVNTLAGRSARRMCLLYPRARQVFIRVLVSEAKAIGTPTARRTAIGLLREMYTDIYGEDPVGKREFRKWVQGSLTPQPAGANEPVNDVSLDDGFDATAEDIT